MPRFLKRAAYSFLLLGLLYGCQQEVYNYFDGFHNYMLQEHQVDVSKTKDHIYYIIPFSNCNSCQGSDLNLSLLEEQQIQQEKITLLLTGNLQQSTHRQRIRKLSNHYTTIQDEGNAIDQYPTGLSKPILLHIQNGSVKKYFLINDPDIPQVKEYLQNLI
ncbi:MAG: hypothetical protein AAFV95_17520 [Bacteroidota bacterium]